MNQNPGWREKYASAIEEGKRQREEQVLHLSEEKEAYERRLKEFRLAKFLERKSFKRDEPSHADLSQPKEEDDDLW